MMRFSNRWKLYELINKYPYKGSHDLAEMLGWKKREKIHKYLRKLLEDGLIKFEDFILNSGKKWGFYPTSVKELINWDEMNSKIEDYKNDI